MTSSTTNAQIEPTPLVDRILSLTEQAQQLIENGSWADASALETERLALLTELFERDDIAALDTEREQLARDLLARNGHMVAMLQEQRTRLNETSRRLNSAPRAVDAYRRNAPANRWARPE